MILSLASKNIVRGKRNSILVILLIASITLLFFMGNSIISRSDMGLRGAYIDSMTGEVIIEKAGDVTMNLFGANTPIIEDFFTIPELPAFDAVMELIQAEPGVSHITSQVSTKAYLDLLGRREAALICGADPASYFDAFPGIVLEAGEFLLPGEYGAMITLERAERLAAQSGAQPAIGTPLLLTAGGAAGFKIREVPLKGIYRYENSGPLMDEIVITDPQTARILASIQVAASDSPPETDSGLLDSSLDDLFGLFDSDTYTDDEYDDSENAAMTAESLSGFLNSFNEESEALIGGGWNFILLRLENNIDAPRFITALNRKLESLGATALGWRFAAGNSAIMLLLIQTLFNGGIVLVSVAGIIAAVNILLISVFKRTKEIGTLRAIGAGDWYIRLLILGENIFLSAAAGFFSIVLGAFIISAVNRAQIAIPNDLIASLLGGPVLNLAFIPSIAFSSFILAVTLGLAASLYPIEAAVHIAPIVAVRQG
jgi:ABC-type antimicrobial peptide transport system permease subunit